MENECIVIDGKKLSNKLLYILSLINKALKNEYNIIPKIATILVGDNPASKLYVKNKIKKASEIGIGTEFIHLDKEVEGKILEEKIESLNNDQSVNGILVQLPLPKHISEELIMDKIAPVKDVDGFHIHNVGMLNTWRDCMVPCTPQGILMILQSVFGTDISSKKVTIIGRSKIVGRPLASLLLQENCTVTIVHSKTKDPINECKGADILISAVGVPKMITKDWVKSGACVIDVGITKLDNKLLGDVSFDEVKQVASFITPVPGGVGPMTIACLLKNTIEACCKQNNLRFETLYDKAKN